MKVLLIVALLAASTALAQRPPTPPSGPGNPHCPSSCQIAPWDCARVPPWDRLISWVLCVIGGRCPR